MLQHGAAFFNEVFLSLRGAVYACLKLKTWGTQILSSTWVVDFKADIGQ